jgi:hypothetical protein
MVQLPDERVYERPQLNAWKFVSFRAFEITLQKNLNLPECRTNGSACSRRHGKPCSDKGASITLSA